MIKIAHYQLQDELGKGGMGTVYKGVDTRTDTPVAIKHLHANLTDDAMIERFKREGEALRELNHPNIVKMLDAVQNDDDHYLIMEYVSGGDLSDLIESEGKLDYRRCVDMAIDLADALTRAHRLNIIHRDLKPANVLIADDGTLRLTDFGVAHIGSKKRVTDTDAIVGTIDYLPPEALKETTYDARGDIWAVGVMLFEMLAGKHPFAGDTLGATITAILTAPVPDLEILAPDTPIALVDLAYRMLEREPNARIASVRHVGAELEDILHGREKTPVPTLFETPTPDYLHRLKHNLPAQTTPFVGREHELAELAKLIADPDLRLMTILAPGGMGKTRLAMEAIQRALPEFMDGGYMVELAPLPDPNNIVSALADAVGYQFQSDGRDPKTQLLDFLANKHMLLLLDNFEHLLAGARIVSDILKHAQFVKILVTSRQRLSQTGETLFHLAGMEFPDWETPEDALEYAAVKLFMNSAKRAKPDFELTEDNLNYVARICRMVQGMPLGIVLSASWLAMLTLQEIADEITQGIDILETDETELPERQRSIRAVMDYAWNQMTKAEQRVFMKLSVFRGGFTKAAAQEVADADLRILMSLVNKSLIRRDVNTGRYQIHELLRQYSEVRLEEVDHRDLVQRAFADYFAEFMEERYLDIKGRRQIDALNDVEVDFENIRGVWQWASNNNERRIIDRMVDGVYWYHDMRGRYHEGVEILLLAERAFTHEQDAVFHRVRIRRIRHIVIAALQEFTFEIAEIQDSLEAGRARQDKAEVAFCLYVLASHYILEDYDEGVPYIEESHQLYLELDDPFLLSEVLVYLSRVRRLQGDTASAQSLLEEALDLKQSINDVSGVGWTLFNYAAIMSPIRDYERAEKSIKQGIAYMRQLKTDHGVVLFSNVLSWISLFKGDIVQARDTAMGVLKLAREQNNLVGTVQASTVLGIVGYILDDDPELTNEIVENIRNIPDSVERYATFPGQIDFCFVMSALYSGDLELAKAEFSQCAQRLPRDRKLTLPCVVLFAIKALIDAHDGQLENATEWLAVAYHLPYQNGDWLEDWALITDLRRDLKKSLGETAFEKAWENGKTRDMDNVVQELLDEFGDSS